jgi:hypothetical protein
MSTICNREYAVAPAGKGAEVHTSGTDAGPVERARKDVRFSEADLEPAKPKNNYSVAPSL